MVVAWLSVSGLACGDAARDGEAPPRWEDPTLGDLVALEGQRADGGLNARDGSLALPSAAAASERRDDPAASNTDGAASAPPISTSDASSPRPGTSGADAGTQTDTGSGSSPVASGGGVVVGYYPAWATYQRDFQVSQIDAGKLTHINYAFANVEGGRCVLGDAWADVQKTFSGDSWDESSANGAGNFKQLRQLKAAHPELRTLISVGGWTWSGKFSDVAASDGSRRTFASSCVDFMVEHGFDGIDVDWEYPVAGGLEGNAVRPEDKANYTLLLEALRAELSARQAKLARGEAFLLTIAAPAGPSIIAHLEPAKIAEVVDWINIMSYDFHGAWEKITGHNAPLTQASGDALSGFNVSSAIDAYLAAGAPASRLVMGVPFYGRSFAGVSAGSTHGLHQATTGAGPGTWENGVLDYHDIVKRYLGAPGYTRYVDDSASTPLLFNAGTGVFVSYDDPESIRKKRALIGQKKLRGAMIWDLSSDTADYALLTALTGG
jgi:chitinase